MRRPSGSYEELANLNFGLVTFPVRLFAAARAGGVHFHMLHRSDLSRVKEVWCCSDEDKPIPCVIDLMEALKAEPQI